jgi:hypothetical protein
MRHLGAAGFGFVSILLSLLILCALVVFYLRDSIATGPKGGAPGGALEASKIRAQEFEAQQRDRMKQMDEAAQ